ncbi:heterokaryon incompatibility protein-domain-containing protein [Hypomontagnella submonticulosa]|nr:heterokaryon incompatibility protein-domain-containing protein [Hypomontagnella submonticulosa]
MTAEADGDPTWSNVDDICAYCARIFPIKSTYSTNNTIRHHENLSDLLKGAETCILCKQLCHENSLGYIRQRYPNLTTETAYSLITLEIERQDANVQHTGVSGVILEVSLKIEQHAFTVASRLSITTCEANSPIASRDIWLRSSSSRSERIQILKCWYNECTSDHDQCKRGTGGLPERLISIGSSEGAQPHLVLTEELNTKEIPYATLSHCWGNHLPLQMTRNNEKQFMERIPMEIIPQTFRDALDICKALSIPYLWIDALCIPQDDAVGWQREAANMKNIYSSSVLTIAAADAENSLQGCFEKLDVDQSKKGDQPPVCFKIRVASSTILIRVQRGRVTGFVDNTILSTRGWTLQEKILSGRIVHCMQEEIHWQCYCGYKTETGLSFSWPATVSLTSLRNDVSYKLQTVWHRWMENYSRRNFSVRSDRLAALAGLVQQVESGTGDEAFLEIWGSSFIKDMLWMRVGRPIKDTSLVLPNVPSWSWLSRCKDVSYNHWMQDEEQQTGVVYHATMKDCRVTWTGPPYTSEIESTRLLLEGTIKKIKLSVPPEAADSNPLYLDVEDEVCNFTQSLWPWWCIGQFDFEQTRPPARYACLLMYSKPFGRQRREIFLILEPVQQKGGRDVYRRIGIGAFKNTTSQFDLTDRRELQLV